MDDAIDQTAWWHERSEDLAWEVQDEQNLQILLNEHCGRIIYNSRSLKLLASYHRDRVSSRSVVCGFGLGLDLV